MAVELEFIDFIVPIARIREKYPGGWEQCVRDHANLIGRCVWYDDRLLRDGAMNPRDIYSLIDEWEAFGFEPTTMRDGKEVWNDVCVVESLLGGPTLPCEWLTVDPDHRIAYYKGTEPGEIVGRKSFPAA